MTLCKKWFDGDIIECRRLHKKYLKLMKMMFCEVNPIPVKTAAEIMKLCSAEMRLPMCEIGEDNRKKLEKLLDEYELI